MVDDLLEELQLFYSMLPYDTKMGSKATNVEIKQFNLKSAKWAAINSMVCNA